jgi:hypothetical protein
MQAALNRLAKWRSVLTGRILGTRPLDDPPTQGFRDIFEKLLILRAELTALTQVLADRRLLERDELASAIAAEAVWLADEYAKKFPGMTATDDGITLTAEAAETMKGWPP